MSNTPYFDVVIGRQRGDKKRWHKIGRAWFHRATKNKEERLVIDLNSLPPDDADVRLFPPEDQAPLDCAERFNVVVPIETEGDGETSTYFHTIGTVFHNPPTDDRAENFNILLDSLPMSSRLLLFPARPAEQESEQAA